MGNLMGCFGLSATPDLLPEEILTPTSSGALFFFFCKMVSFISGCVIVVAILVSKTFFLGI